MANEIDIILKATDQASAAINGVNKKLGETGSVGKSTGTSISGLTSSFKTLAGPLGAASVAFGALTKYMLDSEKAAVESAQSQAKQEAILKATGYAANIAASELNTMAGELSKLNEIDDEAIAGVQSMLLTFREIGRDAFPRATQAIIDLQTTFGSLEASSVQVGKALNDPVTGMTALAKSGITFSEVQKQQIKLFSETNQVAKAQDIILTEIENQVKGTAAAIAAAGDGSKRLKISYDNLSEAVGVRLIPLQRAWNNALADTYDALTENVEASNRYAQAQVEVAKQTGRTNEQQNKYAYYSKNSSQSTANLTAEIIRATNYGEAWERTLRNQGVEFEGNTSKIKPYSESIQQVEVDYKSLLMTTESLAKADRKYTDDLKSMGDERIKVEQDLATARAQGYWETSDKVQGYKDKLTELDDKVQETKDKHREATNQMVYDMTIAKLSVDGLTDAEFAQAQRLGESLGLFTEAQAKEAIAINELTTAAANGRIAVETLGNAINLLPSGKTVDVIINMVSNAGVTAMAKYGQSYREQYNERAVGGPSSGMTWVGENGPELLNLPSGSYVNSAAQSKQIATNSQQQSGPISLDVATIDAMARAFSAALSRAG